MDESHQLTVSCIRKICDFLDSRYASVYCEDQVVIDIPGEKPLKADSMWQAMLDARDRWMDELIQE